MMIHRGKDISETVVGALILLLPILTFLLISSRPEVREFYPDYESVDSLKGQHSLTLQSEENIKFAKQTSLFTALSDYFPTWPPAYPGMLYLFGIFGVSPPALNLAFYILNAAFFVHYLKKGKLTMPATYLTFSVFAFGAFHYHNLAIQIVSEGFFVFFSWIVFSQLLRYQQSPRRSLPVVVSGLITACMILTKYIAAVWIFPVSILCILIYSERIRRGLRHVAIYSILSLLPTLPWFLWIYRRTGHLTGMDRGNERPIRHLTDFWHNAFYILKTYYVDFFSANWASHSLITGRYRFGVWDLLVSLALLFTAVFIGIRWKIDRQATSRPILDGIRTLLEKDILLFQSLLFWISYIGVLLAVWTFGNNDPIYTRFVYPSYGFGLLTIALVSKRISTGPANVVSFSARYLLPVLVLSGQLYKTLVLIKRYGPF